MSAPNSRRSVRSGTDIGANTPPNLHSPVLPISHDVSLVHVEQLVNPSASFGDGVTQQKGYPWIVCSVVLLDELLPVKVGCGVPP
ncbi:hypothetical protein NMY22_g14797 [Coprinellus aureogranulatus]|nr:hypothetical protein NMY22_g14797 [Coprinellus aureogranulatus]